MDFLRRLIIKMANKMATPYQFTFIRCCGHSNLVIFNGISSKFHIWIASIKPWFKFEYNMLLKGYPLEAKTASEELKLECAYFLGHKFCLTNDNDKMAAAYQFASVRCCGHSNLVIFNWISSKCQIWFASVMPWFKFEYEFRRTIYNQDGRQNGRRLSVCVSPLLWSL